jgi:acylphosphatase
MKHFDILVIGRVQGVNLRRRAKEKADELGLNGVAWNAPDGSVHVEVEADETDAEAFMTWCKGLSGEVEQVQVEAGDVKGMSGFEIRY